MPRSVLGEDREAAVDVYQLRAGHWSRSRQHLHRIGRFPSPACAGCLNKKCPAASCLVCGEEADTPEHVLIDCPCLAGARLRMLGSMYTNDQGPRIVWRLGWGVENLVSKYASRVENSVLNLAYNVENYI